MSTFSGLADRVQLFVPTFNEHSVLTALLEEAELQLTAQVDIVEVAESVNIVADTSEYEMTAGTRRMMYVAYKGIKLALVDQSRVPLDTDGAVYSGEPTGYWTKPKSDGTALTVCLNLAPGSNVTAGLTGAGIKTVISPGASPVIPPEYHIDLCDYAIAIAAQMKGDSRMHSKHWALWLDKIEKIKARQGERDRVGWIREDV